MSYPQHKYSNYIDQEFSFSNRVYPSKVDIVDMVKHMRCDGSIMLEPRLQEYIKKKQHYKKNGIELCYPLEKEFQITKKDKKMIKRFLQGGTDIYDYDNNEFGMRNERKKRKQYFPSKAFRDNDERVLKVNKQTRDAPPNLGMFAPNAGESYYEGPVTNFDENSIIDSRYFSNGYGFKGFNLNESRFDPRTDTKMEYGLEEFNKYDSQYRVDPQFRYEQVDPRNKYIISDLTKGEHSHGQNTLASNYQFEQRDYDNYNLLDEDVQTILGRRDSYASQVVPTFSDKSNMDLRNKVNIPNINASGKKDLNTSGYVRSPFINTMDGITNSMTNANIETEMIRGMPTRTQKSYGFRNPNEHYFHYIDDDFQNPDNSVLPFMQGGESSRLNNKKLAKQNYVRDFTQIV